MNFMMKTVLLPWQRGPGATKRTLVTPTRKSNHLVFYDFKLFVIILGRVKKSPVVKGL